MENSIHLQDVTLSYPLIHSSMSFRTDLLHWVARKVGRSIEEAPQETFVALKDVNLNLVHGDRLGLIGPNGAGKSSLLRVLAGSYIPTQGSVAVNGDITTLLVAGLGMDMDESGYNNIYTCGLVQGMPMDRIEEIRRDIVEFCELGEHINYPVRTYSSGMLVRLSFAIATSVDPGILLIDEIIGAGDAKFAKKSADRLEHTLGNAKILVLASHSDALMRKYCNKGLFLKNGEVQAFGEIDSVLEKYQEWVTS